MSRANTNAARLNGATIRINPCRRASDAQRARRDREERAGQELVRAGVGAVVRAAHVHGREVQRGAAATRRAGHDDQPHDLPPAIAGAPGDQVHRAQEERPAEVELLLDRERPEVHDRIGVDVRREVVVRLADEVPVGDVEERRPESTDRVAHVDRRRDRGVHDRGDDERRRTRPGASAGIAGSRNGGSRCGPPRGGRAAAAG